MALGYHIKSAVGGLWREKWINLISSLTIAAGLLTAAAGIILVYNADLAAKKLPGKFSMVVYLRDGLSSEEIQKTVKTLSKIPAVKKASFISKENALRELKGSLKNAEYILEGLEGNPLSDSVEVKLKEGFVSTSSVSELTLKLKGIEAVQDVEYGEEFLSSVQRIMAGARGIGAVVIAALSTGIVFVCYSTVKILFYRKSEEIETLKLLGATRLFIRAPFIIEGGMLGAMGGLFSAMGAWAFYRLVLERLSLALPIVEVPQISVFAFALLPLAGALIGMTGAAAALGRIKF